jgi:hypothetical protein
VIQGDRHSVGFIFRELLFRWESDSLTLRGSSRILAIGTDDGIRHNLMYSDIAASLDFDSAFFFEK